MECIFLDNKFFIWNMHIKYDQYFKTNKQINRNRVSRDLSFSIFQSYLSPLFNHTELTTHCTFHDNFFNCISGVSPAWNILLIMPHLTNSSSTSWLVSETAPSRKLFQTQAVINVCYHSSAPILLIFTTTHWKYLILHLPDLLHSFE